MTHAAIEAVRTTKIADFNRGAAGGLHGEGHDSRVPCGAK